MPIGSVEAFDVRVLIRFPWLDVVESYGRKWCLTELKKAAYQVEMVVCKQPIQLRRYATMSKHNVVELAGREKIRDELTDLIREGACKLIDLPPSLGPSAS